MAEATKLDADLVRALEVYDPEEEVPVIVYTSGPAALDDVKRSLGTEGRIRSSLDRLDAVSAWVKIRNLRKLAEWDLVTSLEMAQPVEVKHTG